MNTASYALTNIGIYPTDSSVYGDADVLASGTTEWPTTSLPEPDTPLNDQPIDKPTISLLRISDADGLKENGLKQDTSSHMNRPSKEEQNI